MSGRRDRCRDHERQKGVQMDYKVRPAEIGDVREIAEMIGEIEEYFGATDVQPLDTRVTQTEQALFADPPVSYALVAEGPEGHLAGLATYSYLWPGSGTEHNLYLKELFVREDSRRGGVASQMIRMIQSIAAARPGCTRVEWTTEQGNEAGRAFYQALGIPENPGKIRYWIDLASS